MPDRIADNIDMVLAIETIEFHDRNLLSAEMASPDKASIVKRRLLREAYDARLAEITPVRNPDAGG